MFCKCLSLPFCFFQFFEHFSDFFASIFVQNQKFHGRKFTFSSVHFLVFILMFPVLFSLLMFLSRGSDDRGQNTSTKRNEWRQWWEWSPMSEKEVSCWRVFEHDWRSELVDLNQPRRVPWLMILGYVWQQWCVSCGWVTCCVTQTAGGTSAGECLSSSPYVLSLHSYPPHVYPPSSTRGKRLLERLGNLRRWSWTWRIKWSVSKIKRRSC